MHQQPKAHAKHTFATSESPARCSAFVRTKAAKPTPIVHQRWSVNPTKWDGDYAVTNVWRREGGAWKLFRSHWTKVDRGYKG